MKVWCSGVAVLALSACSEVLSLLEPDRPRCVPEPRPALAVFVRDSTTHQWIGAGATLVLRDGAFVDSASHPAGQPSLNSQPLWTPHSWGRAGMYEVRVRRAGYVDTVVRGVQVFKECSVVTRVLTVSMVPATVSRFVARSP